MSCNCGAKNNNKVPCCCSQGSPLVCTTTTCADAQVCNQTVESDCVIYTGPNISCSGITTGMTVTEVIDIILEQLNLINCSYCWNVTNDGSLETTFEYVDADGETIVYRPITVGGTVQVCGRSVDDTNVTVVKIGRCSICDYIPVPTRCTGGTGEVGSDDYYQIERTWSSPTYTFVLNSMILDGVEYANGETLTITGPGDLVTGVSTIDGNTYVMNINDWLNSITGVATSGFVFYDDMHVIDKPSSSSTYTIEIGMSNTTVIAVYYYTSQYGFAIDAPDDILGEYTCELI